MLEWSMTLLAQDPQLSLSLSPSVLEYSGQICGMSQFETRFSSRGKYGSQVAVQDGAGRLVACFAGRCRVIVAVFRPASAHLTLERLAVSAP
jgi:hypothetical protein